MKRKSKKQGKYFFCDVSKKITESTKKSGYTVYVPDNAKLKTKKTKSIQ